MNLAKFFTKAVISTLLLSSTSLLAAPEVNLYSARKEALIKPLLDQFTEKTGISVNLVTGKADALLTRLKSEGRNTPADVFLTTDAGRLHRAEDAKVLQPVQSESLNNAIPASYRDPEGYWFGLSLRARPIMYVKGKVDPKTLSTYEALATPELKGKICIRSSSNIYNQSLVASMIAVDGEAKTESWAKGLVGNMARPPKGGDRDQIKAAAAGQCDIAVANTYYFGKMLAGGDASQKSAAEKLAIFWPNQDGRGTHVNISGAGVTAHAKHKDNAIKLIEFLASEDAQAWYAQVNYEYPVREGVKPSKVLAEWGNFKADNLNLSQLGDLNSKAVMLMDRAGWK
ncbi:Fe(3+) ABC transporter substrate-binding protein [Gammaproteobacteria bacterium 42_54_T18]|nr:Fe(3+) ABC transporter substrate-binding protein [Gammaproteobacteria bacterium 42_54_T18]